MPATLLHRIHWKYLQIRVLDEDRINVIDDFLANVMTFEIHLRQLFFFLVCVLGRVVE